MKSTSHNKFIPWLIAWALGVMPLTVSAFDSGSTGAAGAFNPLVDTEVQLPPDGVFNFTTVNIPAGVTVTFARNALNTPVTILASGNVTIDGTIDISGSNSTDSGAAGDGNVGDDGLPGLGGPGGYDGGRGAESGRNLGGSGLGPGGGQRAQGTGVGGYNGLGCGGGGGGFANSGSNQRGTGSCPDGAAGGSSYGVAALLPLIGGSGGGGASSGDAFSGCGGGGGGGAIIIASSDTITVNGSVDAQGGYGCDSSGAGRGGGGGGGSGGAIRIIATTIAGNGTITTQGGNGGDAGASRGLNGGRGSDGRIRLEAENMLRTAGTTPQFSFAEPQEVFVAGLPTLRIASVAGVAALVTPTGDADIILPEDTPNPVTVEFESNNVPVGNTVLLQLTPAIGDRVSAISGALSGTEASATASTTIDLPAGPSVMQAQVSYTVTAMLGDFYSRYAMGERVEKVRLAASANGESLTTFITVSGKEYTWPSSTVAMQ